MRRSHELPYGVICERCKQATPPKLFKSIQVREPDRNDSTGKQYTIARLNLCLDCYDIYAQYMFSFLNT